MTEQSSEPDYLLLKWGTLKGWELRSEAAQAAMQKYLNLPTSPSAMTQEMTVDHKARLCEVIDALEDGATIINDWSGDKYTKEEAKQYVMEYQR